MYIVLPHDELWRVESLDGRAVGRPSNDPPDRERAADGLWTRRFRLVCLIPAVYVVIEFIVA